VGFALFVALTSLAAQISFSCLERPIEAWLRTGLLGASKGREQSQSAAVLAARNA
jgi:peptidoglycan/LPS O-acetylase OafA/YrhL